MLKLRFLLGARAPDHELTKISNIYRSRRVFYCSVSGSRVALGSWVSQCRRMCAVVKQAPLAVCVSWYPSRWLWYHCTLSPTTRESQGGSSSTKDLGSLSPCACKALRCVTACSRAGPPPPLEDEPMCELVRLPLCAPTEARRLLGFQWAVSGSRCGALGEVAVPLVWTPSGSVVFFAAFSLLRSPSSVQLLVRLTPCVRGCPAGILFFRDTLGLFLDLWFGT